MPLLDSVSIVKNGHNAQGRQRHWCKDCNKRAALHRSEKKKEEIIGACHERPSIRGAFPACSVSSGRTLLPGSKKRR
ncbi:transposase-like zinc-binding domain-containing protein [Candidatus Electronema sp. TJ]|uniref:IS1/IS1595 family N-terminal zinc-binding domain-containing protein n=1 Tax=Candidatus Electronema sp. TJ TaxID=3401573 RepID=UPI003AA903E1